jgi:lysylphosphatidylglycerol synthetase-like protein (DUF2156 family)
MRWFKVAAIAAGVLLAFLVVSSVIGFLMEAAIAALVVATIVLAVKVAFYRKQVSWNRHNSRSASPPTAVRCPGITGGMSMTNWPG